MKIRAFVVSLVLDVANTLAYGFLFYKAWGWFIAGRVAGLPPLGFSVSVGIMLVANLLQVSNSFSLSLVKAKLYDTDENEWIPCSWAIVKLVIVWPLYLLVLWLWHLVL